MAEGHDLLALYGTWRFHVKRADESKVALLDNLVQRSQTLADLYVRYLDRGLEGQTATKTDDVKLVDDLLQASTWVWLSSRAAISTVSKDLLGDGSEDLAATWDF